MKILLTQSYFLVLDLKSYQEPPYPPLGSLYVATLLKEAGHTVYFFDAMLLTPSEFQAFFRQHQVDLLVIYDDEFNYLTKMCLSNMRDEALEMIAQANSRSVPTIMYSSDAIDHPKPFLDKGCLAVIHGEGEMALTEMIEAQEKKCFEKVRKDIAGISFYEEGNIFRTPLRKQVKDLDEFPTPNWDILDLETYQKIWKQKVGYFSLNVSTTRGCPYSCNWCSKPLYGRSYRVRSAKKVAEEFKLLRDRYGVEHIWITDDIFGLKPGWLKEFVDECQTLGVTVPYKCLSRADLLLRHHSIHYLKKSGCQNVWMGAESGSQKVLDAMDKGITIEQTIKATAQLKKEGIEVGFFLQFGYLGEGWKDIQLTRKLLKSCLPDQVGISVTYPLPGTKFYEMVKQELKQKTHWTDSDDLAMLFGGTFSPQFYRALHRFVHAEYQLYRLIKMYSWKKNLHIGFYFLKTIKHGLFLLFSLLQSPPHKTI